MSVLLGKGAECRICGGKIIPQLDLGLQPACNRFLATPQEPEYKHSFRTGLCQHCGIMQLIDPFPAEELQPKVDWITYTEPEGHLDNLADTLGPMLPGDAFVLGVSFKDDSTLARLGKKRFRTKRLELKNDLSIEHPGAGVETIQDRLTLSRAKSLSQKYGKADALIVRHILEHVYDIPQFLLAIKELLKPNGYAVLEVPDCTKQLELLDYSTLWEEHLVYFTPETYRNCLVQHGFRIEKLDVVPALMENSLVAIVRPDESEGLDGKTIDQAQAEKERQRVQAFTNSFPIQKKRLQAYFRRQATAVFGAGHFSCLLINALELPVLYVIDDNPHKKGLFMPGSHLPIYGSEILAEGRPVGNGNRAFPEVCVLAINPLLEKKIIDHFSAPAAATAFRSFCPASFYSLFTEATALKEYSSEAYYGVGSVLALDKEAVNAAKEQSARTPRQRSRICTHQAITDPLHEMMIIHKRGMYVRPHKHIGKPESLQVLEGNAQVILFDEEGKITQTIPLGEYASGKKFYYRINAALYHTLFITSDTFVFHETTTGPFRREDTVFAPWAPEETNTAAVKKLMDDLEEKLRELNYQSKENSTTTSITTASTLVSPPAPWTAASTSSPAPQPHTLVVGGTKGLGRVMAKMLTQRGHRVSVLGRNKPAPHIEMVNYWPADLAYPDDTIKVINEIMAKNGPITNLIFSQRYRGESNWEKEIAIAVTATAKIIEHLKDRFDQPQDRTRQDQQNAIIVISSIASNFIADEQDGQYHIAKAALNQLVKYYAFTLGPQKIRVNGISPGTTVKEESREFYAQQTERRELYEKITPLRRMGTAEDVAKVVAFLCSDEASFITGQNIVVDGGVSLQSQESLAKQLAPPPSARTTGSNQAPNVTPAAVNLKCRLCPGSNLSLIMNLATTPIGDAYLYEKKELPRYPLNLYLCRECGLLQIPHLIDPALIYRDYIYHTADSLGLVEHFRKYVGSVLSRINPQPNSLVVEIGSNDGSALQCYKNSGMRVLGVDPAREIAENATKKGIATLPEFFNAALAQKIVAEQGKASLIMANNVLANIDDLADIINGIKILLAPDGVFVFETGYALDLIQKKIFDNIYHEHLSYFSVRPLQQFFRRQGLHLIHAERVPTKGGSIRCTVQWASGSRSEHPSVNELLHLERVAGIHTAPTLQQFASQIGELKTQLTTLLTNLKSRGERIAGYGAAVGCTTALYALDVAPFLDFIVDDNVNRQNRYAPGLNLQIKSPAALYDTDYTLILAWQYAEPMIKRHPRYLEQGGKFINFLPNLTIIGK